jgi:dTDP-glucose 4,6-dehydratase
MILVTGGAGFIGGNFILDWLKSNVSEGVVKESISTRSEP